MDETCYEVRDGVARWMVHAGLDLTQVVAKVGAVIARVVDAGIDKLLVDARATSVVGLSLAERYDLVEAWATVARSRVSMAVLIRPEFFDVDHVGRVWAARRGFAFRGFVDEAKALRWLRGAE